MTEGPFTPAEIKKPLWKRPGVGLAAGVTALTTALVIGFAYSRDGGEPRTSLRSEAVAPPTPPESSAQGEPPKLDPDTEGKLAKYGNYLRYVEETSERQNDIARNHVRLRWLAKFACYVPKESNSSEKQWGAFQQFLERGYAEALDSAGLQKAFHNLSYSKRR